MTSSVMEEGHIYVLGFSNDTVKVGRTTDPEARLAKHRITGHHDKATMMKQWVSPLHGNSNWTETELIEFCRKSGTKHRGNEWFSGVSYDKVLAYAQGLDLAPSQRLCYCGDHLISAHMTMPPRRDLEGFMRKELGLLIPPAFDMEFPTGWKHVGDMSDVEKLLVRWETARADVEFLSTLLTRAAKILEGITAEIMEGQG